MLAITITMAAMLRIEVDQSRISAPRPLAGLGREADPASRERTASLPIPLARLAAQPDRRRGGA